MKIKQLLKASLLALSVATVLVIPSVNAQTSSGSGQRISPVRSDLTITPGSTQTVTVSVQNVTNAPQNLQAIVNDFVAGNDETGQPRLLLKPTDNTPASGLKKFIQPIPNFSLAAGETKQIKVTITIPANIAGGGYFGAVRFAAADTNNNGTNVNLSASVGSLILVRVPGNIKDDLRLSSLDVRTSTDAVSSSNIFTNGKTLFAVARFENKGNVQEQPFGKVTVTKGGKTIQTTEINTADPKANVLPDSIRRFGVKIDKATSFGKYTVQGNFGYGSNGQLLTGSVSFYVVPLPYIIGAIVLVVALLLGIFVLPRAIRGYNKRVLRKAGRR